MSSAIGPIRARDAVIFSERTDEELLLDYCQNRDRRSFEELVHRYERELFTYLRRYLGSAEMLTLVPLMVQF